MPAQQLIQDYIDVFQHNLNNIFKQTLVIPYQGGTLMKFNINGEKTADTYLPKAKNLREAILLANITLDNPTNNRLNLAYINGMDVSSRDDTVVIVKTDQGNQWNVLKATIDANHVKHSQPKKRLFGYLWE